MINQKMVRVIFSKLDPYSFYWIVFFSLVLFLQNAWVPGFFQDGYLYAAFGKHAAEMGYWLIPHMSENIYDEFFQHIPFVFALEGLFFKAFGASYLSARIFSYLFVLGTLGITYRWISESSEDRRWAFWGTLVLVLTYPLIKKARFPNTDIPLMFFVTGAFYSYWKIYRGAGGRIWMIVGVFFAGALLCKGPLGLFIPWVVGLHILIMRRWDLLKSIFPWLGLVVGILLFAIWPLLLLKQGRFDIFEWYLKSIFSHTLVESRGVAEYSFFTYVIFLLKQAQPWFVLAIFASFWWVKKARDNAPLFFFLLAFWALLIPLSLVKFKYSQYLMALYPLLAALAGYAITLSLKLENTLRRLFKVLLIIGGLVLLIFPLSSKSGRDQEIFTMLSVVRKLPEVPKDYVLVDGAYPLYNAANLLAFEEHANTYELSKEGFRSWMLGSVGVEKYFNTKLDIRRRKFVFLISTALVEEIEAQHPDTFSLRVFKLIKFDQSNLSVVIDRDLLRNKHFLLTY